MKIAKYIQRSGLASRREAEQLVLQGRVKVAGKIILTPATVLEQGTKILLDGKALPKIQPTQLWRYHKPPGLIVSRSNSQQHSTIFEHLPEKKKNLIAVGRLDLPSEGLLLLTNDGSLARILELPKTGLLRKYQVRVYGNVSQSLLDQLLIGCTIKGIRYAPAKAKIISQNSGRNQWIVITLTEGKNREVRILMESLKLKVNRLIRTGFGPFSLGHLPRGSCAQVPNKQLLELQKK